MQGVTRLCLALVVAVLFTQAHGISLNNVREKFLKPFRHNRADGSQARGSSDAASVATKPRDDILQATGPAGVVVAARQRLFDYGVGIAFTALTQRLQGQRVPDVQVTHAHSPCTFHRPACFASQQCKRTEAPHRSEPHLPILGHA